MRKEIKAAVDAVIAALGQYNITVARDGTVITNGKLSVRIPISVNASRALSNWKAQTINKFLTAPHHKGE